MKSRVRPIISDGNNNFSLNVYIVLIIVLK